MVAAADPAVRELTKAWVLEQFHIAAQAGVEEQLVVLDRVADLILGDHKAALAEYAVATHERIEAQRAGLVVQKREMEKQIKVGLAQADAALAALRPTNRATRRASSKKR